ncbi:hypothetical protein [Pseudomonas azerbaijanorientalis]|jgi:hypothetical protein|uniref:hypothetical protein n=1 Tax=Pseudomonas azerbaijanorientalis TaxID=2842350 RepID=UPI001C3E0344|nr:hypothetical protein [Pseudomonas azerbaijanorientalis]QXH62932.1 hypothetical protein KSS91_05425 [Pseudomonas azerbaijanorientalis]
MFKQFCKYFSPALLLVLGVILLWGSLYSSIVNVDEGEKPAPTFFVVFYVAYFSAFVMVLQAFSSFLLVWAPNKKWVTVLSFLVRLPVMLFTFFVGALSLALAYDVSLLALAPALVYLVATFLFVRQDLALFRRRNA